MWDLNGHYWGNDGVTNMFYKKAKVLNYKEM
jgi:hypothetical protein